MNINEMSVQKLKSMAYDLIGEIERLQGNLRMINNRINQMSAEERTGDAQSEVGEGKEENVASEEKPVVE